MEMIKAKTQYDYTRKEQVMTTRVEARSRLKTKWYTLKQSHLGWSWNNPSEPILGPTCLSAWSK